jgi:hypothetical protein
VLDALEQALHARPSTTGWWSTRLTGRNMFRCGTPRGSTRWAPNPLSAAWEMPTIMSRPRARSGCTGPSPARTVAWTRSRGVQDAGLDGLVQPSATAFDHWVPPPCGLQGAVYSDPRRHRTDASTHKTESPPVPGRFRSCDDYPGTGGMSRSIGET